MDKKLLVVIVVVAGALLVVLFMSRSGGSSSQGGAPFASSSSVQPNPKSPAMSAELRKWLDEPFTHIAINPPQDVHAYFRFQNEHGLPGAHGIRVEVDNGVQGTIGGDWTGTAWRPILDEFCAQNNCTWHLTGPSTVRISVRSTESQ